MSSLLKTLGISLTHRISELHLLHSPYGDPHRDLKMLTLTPQFSFETPDIFF